MSIECREQRKNTCSIEAVRNAYELIHGPFTTKMSDYYNNIYPSIIDNHLLWPYKEAIYKGKKVKIIGKVITIYTETGKISNILYGDYWTKRGRRKINEVYPGQYVYVGDEDGEETKYIPTKIKYKYDIPSENRYIPQKYLEATRGMSLQTSLLRFKGLMENKFGSNYKQMFFKQIPDVFNEDYREELLVDHLGKGGIAIFAISDFVYPTDIKSRDIISKWVKSRYHKGESPKIGHAIVCVGFEKEKRNPNTFKSGKTDGKYIMHDSRFWGTSCKFFIDSIYAGKPFIESLPKDCAEAAMKNGGTPGIIKYVYLVSKEEIPGYCSMLKI